MNKSVAIIVGGTGQFGRILTKKLIKNKKPYKKHKKPYKKQKKTL